MQEPKKLRKSIRHGAFDQPTAGYCPAFVQANVVIVPKQYAFDFFLFSHRNHQACPLVDVLDGGEYESSLAQGSDIRTDVPRYRVYQHGELVNEPISIEEWWHEDLVTFFIGCSFTFESILQKEGIPLRHVDESKNVAMYVTNRRTNSTSIFQGPLVVSMRPVPRDLLHQASKITSRYPNMHGAPVHAGDPAELGIKDLASPDFGEAVTIEDGEVPVFWACGVTPQMAAVHSKLPFMITHAPGHMFITDWTNEEFLRK